MPTRETIAEGLKRLVQAGIRPPGKPDLDEYHRVLQNAPDKAFWEAVYITARRGSWPSPQDLLRLIPTQDELMVQSLPDEVKLALDNELVDYHNDHPFADHVELWAFYVSRAKELIARRTV